MVVFAERAMRQKRITLRLVILVSLVVAGALFLEMRRLLLQFMTEEDTESEEIHLDGGGEGEKIISTREGPSLYMMQNGGTFDITLGQTSDGLPIEMDVEEVLKKAPMQHRLQSDKAKLLSTNASKHLYFEEESVIEKDETIDQNSIDEIYQGYLVKKASSKPCRKNTPRTNIVYLRTHRCASSTMSNIFYRYGELNSLVFALPKLPTFQHYWPLRFQETHVDWSLMDSDKPDILNNVARFQPYTLAEVMSNTSFYVALLRDPISHAESMFEYVDFGFLFKLWNTTDDPFNEYIRDPQSHISRYINNTTYFNPELLLARNAMSFDLGLEPTYFDDEKKIRDFIHSIEERVDIVLIMEYFDESLVLLKNLLCWELDDVIYIKQKVRNNLFRNNIKERSKVMLWKWNRADVLLYEHFKNILINLLQQQDDEYWEEVRALQNRVKTIEEKCLLLKESTTETINSTSFNLPLKLRPYLSPEIDYLCQRLVRNETEYVSTLKAIQKAKIYSKRKSEFDRKFYQRGDVKGNFFFEYENSTLQNKTDGLIETKAEVNEEEPKDVTEDNAKLLSIN